MLERPRRRQVHERGGERRPREPGGEPGGLGRHQPAGHLHQRADIRAEADDQEAGERVQRAASHVGLKKYVFYSLGVYSTYKYVNNTTTYF